MKQKITICLLAILTTCAIDAIVEMTDKATKDAQWNFEIYNKSPDAITVSANFDGRIGQIFGMPMRVESWGKIRTQLTNIVMPLRVSITRPGIPTQSFYLVPCPQRDDCNKTMFLIFDQNGLRPQVSGLFRGSLGLTNSGLSLENNIEEKYIFDEEKYLLEQEVKSLQFKEKNILNF